MKTHLTYLTAPALASILMLPAAGAQTPVPVSDSLSRTEAVGMASSHHLAPGTPVKGSDLIGMKIDNAQKQRVGRVDDLAVNLETGRVVQVIVSTGGFLSMGDRTLAIPPSAFSFSAHEKALQLDVTPERLKAAPAFDAGKWTEYYQSDQLKESERYYGQDSASLHHEARAASQAMNGSGYVQKGSKVIGLAVRNLQDEKIGSVENLVIGMPSGRVLAVVVSSGGFLGMGDTLSAVPPSALRYNATHDRLQLDTTKEALAKAPHFKAQEWPDFAQSDYSDSLQRAYGTGVEAKMGKAMSTDADNSARNVRDRGSRTLTAGDQGGSDSDVKITQEIRKAVVAIKGLSTNARNVKIITVDGRVTLRGPVASAEEKQRIGEIASGVGAANVDNQLEITTR